MMRGAKEIDKAVLGVLRRIVKLDSIACQESALFGTGCWLT